VFAFCLNNFYAFFLWGLPSWIIVFSGNDPTALEYINKTAKCFLVINSFWSCHCTPTFFLKMYLGFVALFLCSCLLVTAEPQYPFYPSPPIAYQNHRQLYPSFYSASDRHQLYIPNYQRWNWGLFITTTTTTSTSTSTTTCTAKVVGACSSGRRKRGLLIGNDDQQENNQVPITPTAVNK
jgi:hypothetical protein